MIAPLISPVGIPSACPIPKRAIPIVAIVLHELPVEREIMVVIIAVANKNISGLKICNP